LADRKIGRSTVIKDARDSRTMAGRGHAAVQTECPLTRALRYGNETIPNRCG
jgi:hypothetical protein